MIKNLDVFFRSLSFSGIAILITAIIVFCILLEIWRRIAKARHERFERLTLLADRANAGDMSSRGACDHSKHIKQDLNYLENGETRVHYSVSRKWF